MMLKGGSIDWRRQLFHHIQYKNTMYQYRVPFSQVLYDVFLKNWDLRWYTGIIMKIAHPFSGLELLLDEFSSLICPSFRLIFS